MIIKVRDQELLKLKYLHSRNVIKNNKILKKIINNPSSEKVANKKIN